MTNAERERAIACLRLAIELAGDGGFMPFTDKEYELMEQLLVEIKEFTNSLTNREE